MSEQQSKPSGPETTEAEDAMRRAIEQAIGLIDAADRAKPEQVLPTLRRVLRAGLVIADEVEAARG